ncbi:ABC transporter substrate-binding protein [Burkholderia sp. WAC0059]|uniref:TRAP transporter substrate-binding protein n=1 Tax=Burkholderia sp. WAC0059 TaxID=2066022 RepID=UPI000C7F4FD9|nr:TRAP transporter substrate-binding protein [Burkholderia sp. WAC0059]PLZ01277.1 ABC transporter substrate-binding protein [Burkholderia sp. WAC0059]
MQSTKRRSFLRSLSLVAAAPVFSVISREARAAEFTLRYANNLPVTHPMNVRAREMAARVLKESNGRVQILVFPNNALGSDTDTLSQLRAGAVDFFTLSPLILGTFIPDAQISGIGFAFSDYGSVWPALDGDLGAWVRARIGATSIFAFERIWDGGFRQITTASKPVAQPKDLQGVKLRVPPSPLWTSMFQDFGAAPASVNFAEVYSALQTHVVDGQENPLSIIYTGKLYEVQKYCSLTSHMWDGFWFLGNKASFARLPADLQAIVRNAVNDAGMKQRADVAQLDRTLRTQLEAAGLRFNEVDKAAFRQQLRTSGFYAEWQKKFGPQAWALLEKYSGQLG